jgi:hypothetical protein
MVGIPQIPISQSFAHTTLQDDIGVWPPPDETAETTAETITFSALCRCDASSSLQYAAE